MKKINRYLIVLSTFIMISSNNYAQNFQLLATDAQGDPTTPSTKDAKNLYFAVDIANDSLWFKIETYDTIQGDWGLSIAIDTNEIPTDGATWPGPTNSSMKYERKITLLNNSFFPPTFGSIKDASGNIISFNVNLTLIDAFTIQINVKLSDIDSDALMNVIAGTGGFDDNIYDDIPDNTYINTGTLTVNEQKEIRIITYHYPNPSKSIFTINYKLPVNQNNGEIIITTLNGEILSKTKIKSNAGEQLIDISGLPSGVYLYSINSSKLNGRANKLILTK
ncbi:MAG TPA: T9SS type A sorting domain-containing protein [Flavobacteriales bacterium]|nr:T9SS type A sorting domain-containing protein [Flavobacteriales bacterium]